VISRDSVGSAASALHSFTGEITMTDSAPQVNAWTQQSMLPPEVLEVVMRVGVSNGGNHVQIQVEWHDASGGKLLGVHSSPSVSLESLNEQLDEFSAEVRRLVLGAVHPFH